MVPAEKADAEDWQSSFLAVALGLGAWLHETRQRPRGRCSLPTSLIASIPDRPPYHRCLPIDGGQGPFSLPDRYRFQPPLDLRAHVRARLGLAQSSPELMIIYGNNDTGTAVPVKPKELRVAGEAITGLTLGVLPDPVNPADEPDGVLGIDVLSRYFVVLDRPGMRFKLLTPGPETARDYRDWAEVELTPHPLKNIPLDFWYMRVWFNGVSLTTLLDLGAGVTMLNWQAAELLGVHKHDYNKLDLPEDLRDVLGTDAPAVRILDMGVAMRGLVWKKQDALVSGAPVFGWFNLDEKPAAIVGPGLLRNNSLAIDFAGRRLFVGPTLPQNLSAGTARPQG